MKRVLSLGNSTVAMKAKMMNRSRGEAAESVLAARRTIHMHSAAEIVKANFILGSYTL